jgi:putative FmdB family regulatory protein
MPIYNYECACGNAYERDYPITDFPRSIKCECGKWARKIISRTQVHGDEPPWLDDTKAMLIDGKNLGGRKEVMAYMKRKGISFEDQGI